MEALQSAHANGSWGKYDGPNCESLIDGLQQLHQGLSVLLCSSGTVAVELALRGLQVASGDEVVLAAYDFSGNFRCIEAVGATPVLVDIDPRTWCLDLNQLESALRPHTKAVIVSHLHGGTARIREICELARRRGAFVVEDACQMPGAAIQGRIAGTWGDVGVLSFGGSKLLTAGRGGAILTPHPAVLQRMKIYSERGNKAFPLSELQAVVLVAQLPRLAEMNLVRSANVKRLLDLLGSEPPDSTVRHRPLDYLTPVTSADADDEPAYYKVAFLWENPVPTRDSRPQFLAAVQAEGIAMDAGFRGFDRRSPRRCRKIGELAAARRAAEQTVLLHHPVLLESAEVIDQVAHGIWKVTSALESQKESARAEK